MPTKRKPQSQSKSRRQPGNRDQGLTSRALALELLSRVLNSGQAFDEALAASYTNERFRDIDGRDRGFARLIAATVLRRRGQLSHVVASHLQKPLAKEAGRVQLILLLGAAQLCFLGAPPHAVLDTAVRLCRNHRSTHRFHRLTNAVLRRVAETGQTQAQALDEVDCNIPDWMLSRWSASYGRDAARDIASASLHEAALDISVKSDASVWAERLEGVVLDTGTVRRQSQGRIDELDGFDEGHWWVQDAAAALPAKLLDPIAGFRVADLCAAPGGKTAQLAAAGALVSAVDQSAERLERVHENLSRLGLEAELITADAATWTPDEGAGTFDAVLVDAPCTATGTIRRHPDILHLKRSDDLNPLIGIQSAILANAGRLLKPGGRLVYCTCSLEPEECEHQIANFLAGHQDFSRQPVQAEEIGGHGEMITPSGELRTLPFHLPHSDRRLAGIDGFYACRLIKDCG